MSEAAAADRGPGVTPNETGEPDWLESLEYIRQTYEFIAGKALFGAHLDAVERGRAVFKLPISPMLGGGVAGGVHGGVLSALADIAVVSAVRTVCVQGDVMRGTAELNISYLRPAIGRELTVTGSILKKGSSLAVGDAEIHNDEGKLIAKARVTYVLGQDGG